MEKEHSCECEKEYYSEEAGAFAVAFQALSSERQNEIRETMRKKEAELGMEKINNLLSFYGKRSNTESGD